MLAHAGGIDEALFVLAPVAVFFALQWLSRRKRRQENEGSGTNDTPGL